VGCGAGGKHGIMGGCKIWRFVLNHDGGKKTLAGISRSESFLFIRYEVSGGEVFLYLIHI
jgi:hypothetical protein